MSELIIFRGLTAEINIPRNNGTKCHEFCTKILEDTTGEEVESIEASTVTLQSKSTKWFLNFGSRERANSRQHGAH